MVDRPFEYSVAFALPVLDLTHLISYITIKTEATIKCPNTYTLGVQCTLNPPSIHTL